MSPAPTARLRPFQPVPFGRYTLLTPLSVGGMGEIFLARLSGSNGFEKLCVIKKILPQLAAEPDFVARFVNEAKILVKLSHGSIAQVLEMNLHDGAPYIALEFVDGKDLRRVAQRIKERGLPFPIPLALYVMTRVLDALGYAHRKKDDRDQALGLVHRDVSPQNVLLSYEGEVKVIDFGLAKSSLSSAKTNPSVVLGKFLYMSPEQARYHRVDRRSDLYAAGLCLYELLAGKNPLEDASPADLLTLVANPRFRPLSEVAPHCPRALSEIVMRALSVDPALRFQTAEEMRARLLGVLLELDPAAGAQSAAELMREQFAAEYQQERKLVSAARDQAELPPQERIAAGKRSTMTALPAIRLSEGLPETTIPNGQARPSPGPPPLPSARAAVPPPPPPATTEYEPPLPSARAAPPPPATTEYEPPLPSARAAPPPPVTTEYEPPLPTARAAPPPPLRAEPPPVARAAPPPLAGREHEPTQPGARASEIAEAHRRAELAARPTRPLAPLLPEAVPEIAVAVEPTRPGIPAPLLGLADEDTTGGAISPLLEPTVPGMVSPLLMQEAGAGQTPTREVPTPAAARRAATAPTRELKVQQIPEGARPTPPPRLAASAPPPPPAAAAAPPIPAAPVDPLAAPRPLPGIPSPLVAAAPPTVPAMPATFGAEAESPVVMGVLLDEAPPPAPTQPEAPAQVASWIEAATSEAAAPPPPPPVPQAAPPVLERSTTPAMVRSATQPTLRSLGQIPGRGAQPRRLGWLSVGVGALVVAIAGYFAHDFYAAGMFDGAIAKLSPSLRQTLHLHAVDPALEVPAVPEAVPLSAEVKAHVGPPGLHPPPAPVAEAPAPAAPAKPAEEEADDDLALIHALPPVRHASARRRSRRLTPLQKEWARARTEFHRLEQERPCEGAGMAMLCTRYRALGASIQSAEDPGDPELLQRVKELRQLIAKKAGS